MAAAENKFSIKLFNKWELEEINVEDLALAVSIYYPFLTFSYLFLPFLIFTVLSSTTTLSAYIERNNL